MKIFKIKKNGQALIEFVLIASLIGVVSFTTLLSLNPDFFKSYFKGGISSSGTVDANGQLTINDYDEGAAPSAPPPVGCVAMPNIGDAEADGTKYAGNFGGNVLCTTPADAGSNTWNVGVVGNTWFVPALSNTDGQSNTTQIAAFAGAGSPYKAATVCENATDNGHDDWYLPSMDELAYIYGNKADIGGFAADKYWSSTSTDCHRAKSYNFGAGAESNCLREHNHKIRCIRHD